MNPIRLLSACSVVLALASFGAAESPIFDVPRMPDVTVDGDAADWGDGGFRVEMLGGRGGIILPADDLDASFRLAWNDRGLLVLVDVSDDVYREYDDVQQLWRMDAVELYVARKRGGREMYQVLLAPGMDGEHNALRHHLYDHRRSDKLKTEHPLSIEAARRADGRRYTMEVLLSWDNLGMSPETGDEAGFQLYVADLDGEGKQHHAIWYPQVGTFRNTNAMHRIRLAEKASPPVTASVRLGYAGLGRVKATITGVRDLAGETAVLVGGQGVEIARAKLERLDGRSLARMQVPYPLPEGAGENQRIVVDGVRVATVDQKILPPPAPAESEALFGARIQRTMTLLDTSTSKAPNPVTILFYGQSIIASDWWQTVAADLRDRFPHADLTIENRSIGGFEAHNLVRTEPADVYPVYPDLIVFHVYAGEYSGDLERILSNIRRHTTAEIVIFTHHAPIPNGQFDDSADVTRLLAQRYNCELVEVREEWRRYIEANDLEPEDLLKDSVHPNELGNHLLAALVSRHFRMNTITPGGWTDRVRRYEAKRLLTDGADDEIVFTGDPWEPVDAPNHSPASRVVLGSDPDSALKLTFEGNRVVAIPGAYAGETGTAKVLVDGKAPSEHVGAYAFTRTSGVGGGWWPAIRRVSHREPLLIEDWTLTVLDVDDKGVPTEFKVAGSETGPDGTGRTDEVFVSDSGRVVIEPRDWVFPHARRVFGSKVEPGFEVRWKAVGLFADVYAPEPPAGKDASKRNGPPRLKRVVLAQGLENTTHTLEIIPNGDGPVPVETIRTHCPPLR